MSLTVLFITAAIPSSLSQEGALQVSEKSNTCRFEDLVFGIFEDLPCSWLPTLDLNYKDSN